MSALSRSVRLSLVAMVFLVFCAGACLFGQGEGFTTKERYLKTETMIPMRDGVKLFTIIYSPREKGRPYPILLRRTPYSSGPYGPDRYRSLLGPSRQFDRDGYIFVFQDVRGKFKSEGRFQVMLPPVRDKKGPADVDESSDTYDTIEWLLANVDGHNGRVGQWGISYDGWETVMGMLDAHPALMASSPQASPADMFIGDDWHHNGAFRLMYAFSWLARNARRREGGPSEERSERFDYGTPWGYRFFLDIGPISRIDDLFFHGQVPAWTEFMEHGTYDEYWQNQNVLRYLDDIRHPVLHVAGWFDAEDFYGPISIYKTMEENQPENDSTLVVGPWLHGGWRSMKGDSLGDISFGSPTSETFQKDIQFPFFQYYLKDSGSWSQTEAIVFETGANRWRRFQQWPPAGVEPRRLYLREEGGLSFSPPPERQADFSDSYVSDPAKPVPFSSSIRTTQGHLWMIEDQRFAATRTDVLVYQTDILEESVTIAGPIIAHLSFSSTGSDADFIVKIIDVFPGDAPDPNPNPRGVRMGDYQMLLAGEVFRSKFRNSYEKPEPLLPGEMTTLEFDLRDRFHTFKKGHRIMIQIQSSWFPVIDRNPQTFVDIYRAAGDAFQKATQTIYRSHRHPSYIELGLLSE